MPLDRFDQYIRSHRFNQEAGHSDVGGPILQIGRNMAGADKHPCMGIPLQYFAGHGDTVHAGHGMICQNHFKAFLCLEIGLQSRLAAISRCNIDTGLTKYPGYGLACFLVVIYQQQASGGPKPSGVRLRNDGRIRRFGRR